MTPAWMDARADACIRLVHGPHTAVIAPAAGGRVLRLSTDGPHGRRDWLVPVCQEGWPADAWPKGGMFPLAPFSNRIRDGRLRWQGDVLTLERDAGQAHALHGYAQTARWQVLDAGERHVDMSYEHPPGKGHWPWRWRADQTIRLSDHGLLVSLALVNLSDEAMPAGLGLHPYFTAIRARLQAAMLWEHEDEIAVRSRPNHQSRWDRGVRTWTAFLARWDGVCELAWDAGPGLRIETDLDQVVLHAPQGQYLCVEPVSHVCDGFNLAASGAADTGLQVLSPGQSIRAHIGLYWTPELA